jgi:4-hydroxy-tetrahydrodipicolinate synthase
MFNGLSAFPLTPMDEAGVNERAFLAIIQRLVKAGVDSIGILESTGNYAYLLVEGSVCVSLSLLLVLLKGFP